MYPPALILIVNHGLSIANDVQEPLDFEDKEGGRVRRGVETVSEMKFQQVERNGGGTVSNAWEENGTGSSSDAMSVVGADQPEITDNAGDTGKVRDEFA